VGLQQHEQNTHMRRNSARAICHGTPIFWAVIVTADMSFITMFDRDVTSWPNCLAIWVRFVASNGLQMEDFWQVVGIIICSTFGLLLQD
jgi:hypothetical protein